MVPHNHTTCKSYKYSLRKANLSRDIYFESFFKIQKKKHGIVLTYEITLYFTQKVTLFLNSDCNKKKLLRNYIILNIS